MGIYVSAVQEEAFSENLTSKGWDLYGIGTALFSSWRNGDPFPGVHSRQVSTLGWTICGL
jgi:hypothetical protein